MQGKGAAARAWAVAVVVVLGMAAGAEAWGTYSCNLQPHDLHKINNATLKAYTESAQLLNASVALLEKKVDAILSVLRPANPSKATWLHVLAEAGTAERDVPGKRERREGEEPSEVKRQDKEDKEKEEKKVVEAEVEENEVEESRPEPRDEDEKDGEPKRGECSVMVLDNHATIGMFYMNTYNHGHCANRHPITSPVRYCLGYCPTRTFVTRNEGIWGQGHECKSCQPSRLETLHIPLACDDGFTFEKAFQNVAECKCRNCRSLLT